MVTVLALWLPILLSAVLVFIASAITHMVLPYHRTDFRKVPREDEVMGALRGIGIPPGDYMIPRAESPKAAQERDFVEKLEQGPVALMTVMPNGSPSMSKNFALWFLFCVVVGVFVAYVTGRALGPGVEYMEVFRIAATVAFVGYALALWENSIWFGRSWSTTLKSTVDGLVYGLLTAGVFGWLWPQ